MFSLDDVVDVTDNIYIYIYILSLVYVCHLAGCIHLKKRPRKLNIEGRDILAFGYAVAWNPREEDVSIELHLHSVIRYYEIDWIWTNISPKAAYLTNRKAISLTIHKSSDSKRSTLM